MTERDYCRWCAGEACDPRACTCPYYCGTDCAAHEDEADDE